MAVGFSNYLELEILDHIFGGATAGNVWTPPASTYFGLHVGAAPPDLELMTGIVEPTSPNNGGYLRVNMANTTATWNAATQNGANEGEKTNKVVIPFPQATTNWGTSGGASNATYWFISDSATIGGGNYLAIGALTTPKAINLGDTASFAAGTVVITLD